MANDLSALIPTLWKRLNVVSRERVGLLRAVNLSSEAEQAAVGDSVKVPIVPAATVTDATPGVTPPDDGDVTPTTVPVTITRDRRVAIRFTGEDERRLRNGGNYDDVFGQRIEQGFRALLNEIETDLAGEYVNASRAWGTPGTTPFGTADDLSDFAEVMAILEEHGAPTSDLHMVLGTRAMAKLRGKQRTLFQVDTAGTDELLRQGIVTRVEGFNLHHTPAIKTHTSGTGSGYLVNGALAKGGKTVAVDTGTGTIVAGDLVSLATDATNSKYVVDTALASGSFGLHDPGLRDAIDDNAAVTLGADYVANMAFARHAIVLAMRAPAMVTNGDLADDRVTVTDPFSGVSFVVSQYPMFRQRQYEIAVVWGWATIKPEHVVVLAG